MWFLLAPKSAHALARQKWCHNAVLESEREHAKSDTNAYIRSYPNFFSHGDIRHAIDPHRGVHLFINVFSSTWRGISLAVLSFRRPRLFFCYFLTILESPFFFLTVRECLFAESDPSRKIGHVGVIKSISCRYCHIYYVRNSDLVRNSHESAL